MTRIVTPLEWRATTAHPGSVPDCAECGQDVFVFLALTRVTMCVCATCGNVALKKDRLE